MPQVLEATPAALRAWLRRKRQRVLGFVGYSGRGYRDEAAMLAAAEAELQRHDPRRTLVAIGGTPEGIGAVYPLAKRLGFGTLGIVSSRALAEGLHFSDAVDTVFVLPDQHWGGFVPGSRRLSPTSAALVRSCTALVAIGGGEIAEAEAAGARRAGKPVRRVAAAPARRGGSAPARADNDPAAGAMTGG